MTKKESIRIANGLCPEPHGRLDGYLTSGSSDSRGVPGLDGNMLWDLHVCRKCGFQALGRRLPDGADLFVPTTPERTAELRQRVKAIDEHCQAVFEKQMDKLQRGLFRTWARELEAEAPRGFKRFRRKMIPRLHSPQL